MDEMIKEALAYAHKLPSKYGLRQRAALAAEAMYGPDHTHRRAVVERAGLEILSVLRLREATAEVEHG